MRIILGSLCLLAVLSAAPYQVQVPPDSQTFTLSPNGEPLLKLGSNPQTRDRIRGYSGLPDEKISEFLADLQERIIEDVRKDGVADEGIKELFNTGLAEVYLGGESAAAKMPRMRKWYARWTGRGLTTISPTDAFHGAVQNGIGPLARQLRRKGMSDEQIAAIIPGLRQQLRESLRGQGYPEAATAEFFDQGFDVILLGDGAEEDDELLMRYELWSDQWRNSEEYIEERKMKEARTEIMSRFASFFKNTFSMSSMMSTMSELAGPYAESKELMKEHLAMLSEAERHTLFMTLSRISKQIAEEKELDPALVKASLLDYLH